MKNYQRYNDYIDNHANNIINYVDQYFAESKEKIKEDVLKMVKSFLSANPIHYVVDTSNCTYDNSGELVDKGKISLNQTIQSFLEHEYTGYRSATYEPGCGYTYPTYGDELNDKVGEYGYNIMKQLIKKYLEDHLEESIADYNFKELEDESCGFDEILGDSIVIKFNYYDFVFELVGIDDQLALKDIK